jgi:N-acetylmuramoyl-L-alanine amidase
VGVVAKWFIDPGHGGTESGAVNNVVQEKNINLVVALEVKRLLLYYGEEVLMSRETDKTVDLAERARMSDAWGADYFVSIHHNDAPSRTADGAETIHSIYYGQGTLLAQAIAKEFEAIGQNVKSIFSRKSDNTGKDYYAVIRQPKASSVITEFGYMNTPADYAQFDTTEELLLEAKAIVTGCLKHIGKAMIPKVMYRVVVDGTQVAALSIQADAEREAVAQADRAGAKHAEVQRNTDNVVVFTYNRDPYRDWGKVAVWAQTAVKTMHDLGIMVGDDEGNFRPKDPLTREEAAQLVYNLLKNLGKI